MKLQFDANQPHQLDAIRAVVDLFERQTRDSPEHSISHSGNGVPSDPENAELGIGNRLLPSHERLLTTVRTVQARNGIEIPDSKACLGAWDFIDAVAETARACPHFSVQMETGTGKTYVYLRTIFELSRRHGYLKFIIVVPSVAIREGVLKNIEMTAGHFRALYNNLLFTHFVYDAGKIHRLREFAVSNTLQILIINIDAFRKNFTGPERERTCNVIYKESDTLSGRQPIEFIQAARPIVIIDEPQSVDSTEKAREAIAALNPLCTLRYSATHRDAYNLVYRLDAVRAFELRLVKQIVVASAAADGANDAFVRIEKIGYKPTIRARLRIQTRTMAGAREKSFTVKSGADLHLLSGGQAAYASGYVIAGIDAEPGNERVRFNSGMVLRLGEETGGNREGVWRAQIKHTVRKHLDKELELRGRGIKVLSLFFIDRVANYRTYVVAGEPVKGKLAEAFESELAEFTKEARYANLEWLALPFHRLHNGYFAADKRGMFKDTRGDTHADDEVYNLIMRNKERLLSEDEPLRFIFTHSALREGWDNPNVFQICTLNETHSVIKKRQEIGRGLRLPVDQNGRRVFDESVNKLFVMANESYEDFARALQSEYEEDCGISFSKVPIAAIVTKDGASRVEGRTSTGLNDRRANAEAKCSVGSDTDALVERAIEGIRRMEKIEAPVVQVTAGQLAIKADGIAVRSTLTAKEVEAASLAPLPDILGFLESETELTRSTLVRILKGSGRLVELFVDPHRFMFAVAKVLKHQLAGPITSPERRFGPSQTPVPARQA